MKHYSIAGLRVAMDSFGRTKRQSEPYAIALDGEPDIIIRSFAELLQQQRPHLSLNDCEYLATGSSFYTQLMMYNGIMLHSSCVVLDNWAYLFTASPGTGKSTHTDLWLKKFGDRAFILNDDKPALRIEDGVWYAYGTPWSGKHDISRNARVPVAGIAVLERSESNVIELYNDSNELIRFLLSQVARPSGANYRVILMDLLDKLLATVPVWKLKCNIDPEAAEISYQAMSGYIKEK